MSEIITKRIGKIIEKRWGTHPILNIPAIEWLESTIHAKTIKFDIGRGGDVPEVNWEDRCAAIAMIKSTPARAMAHLLVWGYDPEQYEVIKLYLAGKMAAQCRADNKAMPKGCKYGIDEVSYRIAGMVLDNTFFNLWDLNTALGRLLFGEVDINDRTYSNQLLGYQRLMMDVLADLAGKIEDDITKYKNNLKK